MLKLVCHCCGVVAEETEFTRGQEAHLVRPDCKTASDEEWAAYFYTRRNPAGLALETWHHSFGCGKWFHLARNTVTQQFYGTYGIEEPAPLQRLRALMKQGSAR